MYKEDSALNNLQWLICHKTKPGHIPPIYMYQPDLALNNLQWLICHKTKPTIQTKFLFLIPLVKFTSFIECPSYF